MIKTRFAIYLASGSPRRKKLLEQMNLKFSVMKVNCDEINDLNQTPLRNVLRIAEEKMDCALEKKKKGIIITADTIVVIDGRIIGKPTSKRNAVDILSILSGRKHHVYTGICVQNTVSGKRITGYEKTAVTFRELSIAEIKEYVDSGSPMDKAGAYGIQDDYGAVFVEKISGCYYNVVGLPLTKLYGMLKEVSV